MHRFTHSRSGEFVQKLAEMDRQLSKMHTEVMAMRQRIIGVEQDAAVCYWLRDVAGLMASTAGAVASTIDLIQDATEE